LGGAQFIHTFEQFILRKSILPNMSKQHSVIHGFRSETLKAIDAVAQALELAERGVGAGDITSKGGRDVVTPTDVAVEDAVRDLLTEALGLAVVGEERGGDVPADGVPYWLVDPICGTRNFASGTPLYCVNLGLVEGDRVTVAVVGDPSTGEIALAERGRGAWALKDGARRQLTTSDESLTIVIEDGKSKGARREHAAQFIAEAIRADRWDFRSLGSTLALPYLAAGRISAYVVFWVSAVHAGPGSLLVTEAGGTLSDIDGQPWTIHSDSIVVSANRDLHQELLNLARATAPQRA
jgi:myo-inositol-1(or 4)-monophosphatase